MENKSNSAKTVRAELREIYDATEKAALAGDVDAYFASVADDIVFDVHGSVDKGKDAIRKTVPEDFKVELRINSLETFLEGDVVWDWVEMCVPGSDDPVMRLLYHYERTNGKLLCTRMTYLEAPLQDALLEK